VLTSGQASSAYDGRELLGRLVQLAGGGLTVMAGGGVRVDNAADIVRETGVGELHFSASRRIDAGRSAGVVTMGDQSAADRERRVTDGEAVRTIMERCRQVAR
jgi:copper homeostasis protein